MVGCDILEKLGPSIAALIVGMISFIGLFFINKNGQDVAKMQIRAEISLKYLQHWIDIFRNTTSEFISTTNIFLYHNPIEKSIDIESMKTNYQKIIDNQPTFSRKISELELLLDLKNEKHHRFYTLVHEYKDVVLAKEKNEGLISDKVTELRLSAAEVIREKTDWIFESIK